MLGLVSLLLANSLGSIWPNFDKLPISELSAKNDEFYKYDYDGHLELSISVGTPPQGPFKFKWGPLLTTEERILAVSDKNYGHGYFSPNQSSTFVFQWKPGRSASSYVGLDSIQLLSGPTIENVEVDVVPMYYGGTGDLNLNIDDEMGKSFTDHVLGQLGGCAITLQIENSDYQSHKGSIIFGPPNPKGCSDDWDIHPTYSISHIDYAIPVDEVRIGDFRHTKNIAMAFEADDHYLDPATYDFAVKHLNISETTTMSCETNAELIITAGGQQWVLGPYDYMWMWSGPPELCQFKFERAVEKVSRLPLRFLNGKCLRYDFEKATVSFADLQKKRE